MIYKDLHYSMACDNRSYDLYNINSNYSYHDTTTFSNTIETKKPTNLSTEQRLINIIKILNR